MDELVRHFERSAFGEKFRQLLVRSCRSAPAKKKVDYAVHVTAKRVAGYLTGARDAPAQKQAARIQLKALSKLAGKMLSMAKEIALAREEIIVDRFSLTTPSAEHYAPIEYRKKMHGPIRAYIEPTDFASMEIFIEHYGRAWKAMCLTQTGRPREDAKVSLICQVLFHWEELTDRDGDTSKKSADRQGRPTFRSAAAILQAYINDTMKRVFKVKGGANFTDENLDTSIRVAVDLKRTSGLMSVEDLDREKAAFIERGNALAKKWKPERR